MSIYPLVLFVHLVGAIAIFSVIIFWLFGLAGLRQARSVEQVRAIASLIVTSGNLAVGGVLLLGIAGLYLALTTWGWQTAWIDVATVSFVLLAPFGAGVIDPRIRTLARAASEAPDGPLPASLAAGTHDPILGTGLHVYVAVLLGIVFLMTTKPTLVAAIVAMVVAVVLGLASGLTLGRVARTQPPAMSTSATPMGVPETDQRGRSRRE